MNDQKSAPPVQDDSDIPIETRRELMQCATANGSISYYYLCDLFRRGRRSAIRELEPILVQAGKDVCSLRCPSVKNTGEAWTHVAECQAIQAALSVSSHRRQEKSI